MEKKSDRKSPYAEPKYRGAQWWLCPELTATRECQVKRRRTQRYADDSPSLLPSHPLPHSGLLSWRDRDADSVEMLETASRRCHREGAVAVYHLYLSRTSKIICSYRTRVIECYNNKSIHNTFEFSLSMYIWRTIVTLRRMGRSLHNQSVFAKYDPQNILSRSVQITASVARRLKLHQHTNSVAQNISIFNSLKVLHSKEITLRDF